MPFPKTEDELAKAGYVFEKNRKMYCLQSRTSLVLDPQRQTYAFE